MLKISRNLILDIYDYSENKICNLYDKTSDLSGQATDVYVTTQRNGFKELNFTVPSTVVTAEGQQKNYRLDYVVAGYKIRLQDDFGVDWFIISGPKITHKNFSQDIQVVAGHTGQTLNTKNLGLEFSDEEGNNVGTAKELLDTILEGTGWRAGEVVEFKEDDGTIKRRSLKASAKTGAFSLITKMCSLFDAKPVYNGDSKTVDIKPMNPFSRPENGALPQVASEDVLELHYSNNVSNITRTLNTDSMITKLYAYGSFGDVDLGYCGLDECEHAQHKFITQQNLVAGKTYNLEFTDSTDVVVHKHFTPTENVPSGSVLIFSELDYASMMYLWNETAQKAYLLEDGSSSLYDTFTYDYIVTEEKNYFSFLMDFRYYQQIGLFSDNMLQVLATYQRMSPAYYQATSEAVSEFDTAEADLFKTVGTSDFCRLNVTSVVNDGQYKQIILAETEEYPKGIIYSSQYDIKPDKWFKWRVATAVKPNGESLNEEASVIYAIRTQPNGTTTWDKCYIKSMSEDQKQLTLWVPRNNTTISSTDRFYIFSQNSVSGNLGAYEVLWMANNSALDAVTTIVTAKHPVYISTENVHLSSDMQFDGHAWYYKYSIGSDESYLYFMHKDWRDTTWKRVYVDKDTVALHVNSYFFDISKNKLYIGRSSGWEQIEDTAENKRLFSTFSTVIYYCQQQGMIYQDTYEKYEYKPTANLPKGNYYIDTGYGQYKLFSTTQAIPTTGSIVYDTAKTTVTQHTSNGQTMLTTKSYQYNAVVYQTDNTFRDVLFSHVDLDNNGKEISDDTANKKVWSSKYFNVYPDQVYDFISTESSLGAGDPFTFYFYDNDLNFVTLYNLPSGISEIYVPENVYHIRMKVQLNDESKTTDATKYTMRSKNYNTTIVAKDEYYKYLTSWQDMTAIGNTRSLPATIKRFADYADMAYITKFNNKKDKQQQQTDFENSFADTLGQIYKEGYWQKADYVDGDEDKLYKDAMDNLNNIAKPEKKYSITYLDLYGSDYANMSVNELTAIEWPDINIDKAVHLIDDDINVNEWAFIDKIQKCYDKPWLTKIEINTNLTLMAQHSFSDVMSHIAQIANQMNAKETKYDKAITANSAGQMGADLLEGTIDANRLKMLGGDSTWYTDTHGNIIFESGDGLSAMMLTGNGFCIANSKDEWGDWIWRTFGTGNGFSADEIVTGFLSAERILAGSITTDKISPVVGGQLELSANPTVENINTRITIAEGKIEQAIQNVNKTYYQASDPKLDPNIGKDKLTKGDYWVKPTTYVDPESKQSRSAVQNYIWTGTQWNSIDASTMVLSESSRITQTANEISQQVTRATTAQGNLDSKITQTSSDILLEVSNNYYGKKSSVEIDTDGIHILTTGKLDMKSGALIEIESGAGLNVQSGGDINVQNGGDINLASGGKINVASGGDIEVASGGDINLASGGKINIASGADIEVASGGDINMASGGNLNINSGGNLNINSGGNVDIKGGTLTVESSSTLNVKGSQINLDASSDLNINGSDVVLNSNGTMTIKGGSSIDIQSTGNLTVDSTNFKIDSDGNVSVTGQINAESGQIGGWSISQDKLTSTKTGMATTTEDTDVAFWAGSETPGDAAFRVLQDGTVVLTKLIAQDEKGKTTNVNLRNYPWWKLNYATVQSISVGDDGVTITTTAGSYSFNTAATVTLAGGWSGASFKVTASNGKSYSSGDVSVRVTEWMGNTVTAYAYCDGGIRGRAATIDATSIYDKAVAEFKLETITEQGQPAQKTQKITPIGTSHTPLQVTTLGSIAKKTYEITPVGDSVYSHYACGDAIPGLYHCTSTTITNQMVGRTVPLGTVSVVAYGRGEYLSGLYRAGEKITTYDPSSTLYNEGTQHHFIQSTVPLYSAGTQIDVYPTDAVLYEEGTERTDLYTRT